MNNRDQIRPVSNPNVVTFEGKSQPLSEVRIVMVSGQVGGRQLYVLESTVRVVLGRCPFTSNAVCVTVPAGFITDLASVPRVLQWYAPSSHPDYRVAAIVHDYLYKFQVVPRFLADAIFRTLINKRRPGRRWAMWAAVRMAGRKGYRKS
jgi:hypothetical protein